MKSAALKVAYEYTGTTLPLAKGAGPRLLQTAVKAAAI